MLKPPVAETTFKPERETAAKVPRGVEVTPKTEASTAFCDYLFQQRRHTKVCESVFGCDKHREMYRIQVKPATRWVSSSSGGHAAMAYPALSVLVKIIPGR